MRPQGEILDLVHFVLDLSKRTRAGIQMSIWLDSNWIRFYFEKPQPADYDCIRQVKNGLLQIIERKKEKKELPIALSFGGTKRYPVANPYYFLKFTNAVNNAQVLQIMWQEYFEIEQDLYASDNEIAASRLS